MMLLPKHTYIHVQFSKIEAESQPIEKPNDFNHLNRTTVINLNNIYYIIHQFYLINAAAKQIIGVWWEASDTYNYKFASFAIPIFKLARVWLVSRASRKEREEAELRINIRDDRAPLYRTPSTTVVTRFSLQARTQDEAQQVTIYAPNFSELTDSLTNSDTKHTLQTKFPKIYIGFFPMKKK